VPFDGLSLNRKVEVEPDARCWPIAAAPDRAAMPQGEVILLLSQELPAGGRGGRPLGDETFWERLEGFVGRVPKPQKGGRPKNQENL
jgi:hypothetical protein